MTNTRIVLTFLIFAFLGFFLAFNANAYEVPKDAVIKVFDANGKQIGEMSRSEYKVVKLGTSAPVIKSTYVKETIYKPKKSKHVLSLIGGGGVGNNGYDVETNGHTYSVTDRQRPVGSLGLCATKDGSGVCFLGTTNDTYLMNFLLPLGDLD